VAAPTNDDGYLADANVKAIEQRLYARIGLDVLIRERVAVAAQEFTDLLRGARMARAEQHQVVHVLSHQCDAAQDERAHEELAELRVALDEGAQIFAVDRDDRPVARGTRAHQAAPRRQHVDLAGELALVVHDHRLFAVAERSHDLDGA
jgi:hypothetical protein